MKQNSEILKGMFGIKGHKGGEERRGEGWQEYTNYLPSKHEVK